MASSANKKLQRSIESQDLILSAKLTVDQKSIHISYLLLLLSFVQRKQLKQDRQAHGARRSTLSLKKVVKFDLICMGFGILIGMGVGEFLVKCILGI